MIRKYEKNDHERVMKIWLLSNLEAHGFIRQDYWRGCLDSVSDAISAAEVYTALSGSEIVGFIGLNKGHIEGIFVDGDHRSKGVGKSLIDFAKELYPKLSLCVYEKTSGLWISTGARAFGRSEKSLIYPREKRKYLCGGKLSGSSIICNANTQSESVQKSRSKSA